MTATDVANGTLAGYRLVRKLAIGSRADVYLGVGSTGTVAIKVFAPAVSRESAGAELDALCRVESPHLVRLLDVSRSSGELPVLVFERVQQGSVVALLRERLELEHGEVITLLAPIAAVVAELHDAGVAHGRVGATSVHLGEEGRPVLLGFGHCTLFAPGASKAVIDSEPTAISDRDALAALTVGVLARVRNPSRRAADLARWLEGSPRAYEFPRELEQRLFEIGDPLPMAFPAERRVASAVPSRLAPAEAPARAAAPEPVPGRDPAGPNWLTEAMLEHPLHLLTSRVRALVAAIRPRFWVAAGAVVVTLFLAIALLPGGGTSPPPAVAPTPVPPTARVAAPSSPLPDDPVQASRVLLAARTTCVRELSILCLDGVDEASSAAFASDSTLIQRIQDGGEAGRSVISDPPALALAERLGDTALIGLASGTRPASILVIRTAAGWRIRDYLTGEQATAAP